MCYTSVNTGDDQVGISLLGGGARPGTEPGNAPMKPPMDVTLGPRGHDITGCV